MLPRTVSITFTYIQFQFQFILIKIIHAYIKVVIGAGLLVLAPGRNSDLFDIAAIWAVRIGEPRKSWCNKWTARYSAAETDREMI